MLKAFLGDDDDVGGGNYDDVEEDNQVNIGDDEINNDDKNENKCWRQGWE